MARWHSSKRFNSERKLRQSVKFEYCISLMHKTQDSILHWRQTAPTLIRFIFHLWVWEYFSAENRFFWSISGSGPLCHTKERVCGCVWGDVDQHLWGQAEGLSYEILGESFATLPRLTASEPNLSAQFSPVPVLSRIGTRTAFRCIFPLIHIVFEFKHSLNQRNHVNRLSRTYEIIQLDPLITVLCSELLGALSFNTGPKECTIICCFKCLLRNSISFF